MMSRCAILVCGTVLLAALTVAATIDARAESLVFVTCMLVAGGGYVAALALVPRRPGSRHLLLVCLLLAVTWRGVLVTVPPLVSDDVYRYIWDGRVQRHRLNPYFTAPNDPEARPLHTDLTRRIDPTSAVLPTIYPPGAQLFFRLVTTLHESTLAMAGAIVVCDLLTLIVCWRWLAAAGRDPWWVLAYAWHSLVALEGAGGGHIDALGTLLLVTAGYALSCRRQLLAALSVAAAIAVKFLPVVLLPLFWRRLRPRDAAAALGLIGIAYLAFVSPEGGVPLGSLGAFAAHWRFNGPLFRLLEPVLSPAGVLVLAVLGGLVTAWRLRLLLGVDDPRSWAWPLAVTLLLMPVVYPWYLVWFTPFLTVRANWPLLAWTLTVPLTYLVWEAQLGGAGWVLPVWVVPVEYGIVALTWIGVWRTRLPAVRSGASERTGADADLHRGHDNSAGAGLHGALNSRWPDRSGSARP